MASGRYIYDALYGRIGLPPYVWEIMTVPELQRLREVRLCNINSLCLTGGANINRYEHAIGTAYLALQWLQDQAFGISPEEARLLVLAALLHDVGSAPFGHSAQYVLEKRGYEHESFYDIVARRAEGGRGAFSYQDLRFEQVLFGMQRELHQRLSDDELYEVSELVQGRGRLGPLISGSVDFDNIDNVCRLAYHIGIFGKEFSPVSAARALSLDDGRLRVESADLPLFRAWYDVRRRLYEYLLLNPDEFSAKAMLQEAIEIGLRQSEHAFRWTDIDLQLLNKLSEVADAKEIVQRLMRGELYGTLAIFELPQSDAYAELQEESRRAELEQGIVRVLRGSRVPVFRHALVRVHAISDKNKTQRRIEFLTAEGVAGIGQATDRLLLGVFLKNREFAVGALEAGYPERGRIIALVRSVIAESMLSEVDELVLYGEGDV